MKRSAVERAKSRYSHSMSAIERAESLGATVQGGIAWTWARGFTKEQADTFLAWLNENHYEHRGIYGPAFDAPVKSPTEYAVRFR